MTHRTTTLLAATALALASLGAGPALAADAGGAGGTAQDEYIPFVTDFPRPAAASPSDGRDVEAAVVTGGAAALAALVAGSAAVAVRRSRAGGTDAPLGG